MRMQTLINALPQTLTAALDSFALCAAKGVKIDHSCSAYISQNPIVHFNSV